MDIKSKINVLKITDNIMTFTTGLLIYISVMNVKGILLVYRINFAFVQDKPALMHPY